MNPGGGAIPTAHGLHPRPRLDVTRVPAREGRPGGGIRSYQALRLLGYLHRDAAPDLTPLTLTGSCAPALTKVGRVCSGGAEEAGPQAPGTGPEQQSFST